MEDGSGDIVYTRHGRKANSRRSIRFHDGNPVGEEYFEVDERGNGQIKTYGNEMIEYDNGRKIYRGEYVFVDNKFYWHGRGKEYDLDGNGHVLFEGDFAIGYYHGEGILYRNGNKYFSGRWCFGYPEGDGELYDESGVIDQWKGEWKVGFFDEIDFETGERMVKKKGCGCFSFGNSRKEEIRKREKEIRKREKEWKTMETNSSFVAYRGTSYLFETDRRTSRRSITFRQSSDNSLVRGSVKSDSMFPIDVGICRVILDDDTKIQIGDSVYTGSFAYEKDSIIPRGKGKVAYKGNIVMDGTFEDGKLMKGKIVMWKFSENDSCECECVYEGGFGEGLSWACYPEIENMVQSEKEQSRSKEEWKQIQSCFANCEFTITKRISPGNEEFIGWTTSWSMNYQAHWKPYKHKKDGLLFYGVMDEKCCKNGFGREYDCGMKKLAYVGEFKDNQRHGEGYVFKSPDKTVCNFGIWEKGMPDDERDSKEAQSLLARYNDGKSEAKWKFVRIGRCVEAWPHHPIVEYVGFVDEKDARMVGYINYYKKDEKAGLYTEIRRLYEGCFKDEKYHGKGKLFIKNTYTFEGEFDSGVMVRGVICLNKIPIYEGDVNSRGEMHGKGTLFYQSLAIRNGKVKLATGKFQNGKLHGIAVVYHTPAELKNATSEVKYVGQFENGEMHGKGVWIGENQAYVIGLRNGESIEQVVKEAEGVAEGQDDKWEKSGMIVNCWDRGCLNGVVPVMINNVWYEVEFTMDRPVKLTFTTKDDVIVCSDVQKVDNDGVDIGVMHVKLVGNTEMKRDGVVYTMQTSEWMSSVQTGEDYHSIVIDGNFKNATRKRADGRDEFTGEFMNWEPVRNEQQESGISYGKGNEDGEMGIGKSCSEQLTAEGLTSSPTPKAISNRSSNNQAEKVQGEKKISNPISNSISDEEEDDRTIPRTPSKSDDGGGDSVLKASVSDSQVYSSSSKVFCGVPASDPYGEKQSNLWKEAQEAQQPALSPVRPAFSQERQTSMHSPRQQPSSMPPQSPPMRPGKVPPPPPLSSPLPKTSRQSRSRPQSPSNSSGKALPPPPPSIPPPSIPPQPSQGKYRSPSPNPPIGGNRLPPQRQVRSASPLLTPRPSGLSPAPIEASRSHPTHLTQQHSNPRPVYFLNSIPNVSLSAEGNQLSHH